VRVERHGVSADDVALFVASSLHRQAGLVSCGIADGCVAGIIPFIL
jgi:hypothetical protein